MSNVQGKLPPSDSSLVPVNIVQDFLRQQAEYRQQQQQQQQQQQMMVHQQPRDGSVQDTVRNIIANTDFSNFEQQQMRPRSPGAASAGPATGRRVVQVIKYAVTCRFPNVRPNEGASASCRVHFCQDVGNILLASRIDVLGQCMVLCRRFGAKKQVSH